MNSKEIEQQNIKYRLENESFLNGIIAMESKTLDGIKELFLDDVPREGPTLSKTINRLFDLFEGGEEPLNQHVIVVLHSQFLVQLFRKRIESIQRYYSSLEKALRNDDTEAIVSVLKEKETLHEQWQRIGDFIANIDFEIGLEAALNSGVPLTKTYPRDKIERACLGELKRIGYGSYGSPDKGHGSIS